MLGCVSDFEKNCSIDQLYTPYANERKKEDAGMSGKEKETPASFSNSKALLYYTHKENLAREHLTNEQEQS